MAFCCHCALHPRMAPAAYGSAALTCNGADNGVTLPLHALHSRLGPLNGRLHRRCRERAGGAIGWMRHRSETSDANSKPPFPFGFPLRILWKHDGEESSGSRTGARCDIAEQLHRELTGLVGHSGTRRPCCPGHEEHWSSVDSPSHHR